MKIDVRVISQQPPGGRCQLYADYAEALGQCLGAEVEVVFSSERCAHGEGFPALWLNGQAALPADGVILMPEDILQCLHARQIDATALDALSAALNAALDKMLAQNA
ncbi:MAG: hypothetical protein HY850_05645 [Betaproteobacteria bacterium]|nr:hypothetical protein [Betaproteobacteria bacterium]